MKQALRLLCCFFLIGCSAEKISGDRYGGEKIFGKWKMENYADGRKIPYDVTLELKSEKDNLGRHIIHGKSPLNFYFSTCEVDFNDKSIELFDIQITKVEGEANAVSFETKYYEKLAKINHYEISDDGKHMTLLLPDVENEYILYKLVP